MKKERTTSTRSSLPPLHAARQVAEQRKRTQPLPPSEPEKQPTHKVQNKEPKETPKRKKFRFLLWMFIFMMITGSSITGLTIGMLNRFVNRLDSITFLEDYKPNMPSRMYAGDPNQTLVAEFFSDDLNQNREKAALEDMPAHLKNAVISIEDERFYEHCGISPRAFVRAAIHDIKTRSLEQGGSTITMQLVEDLINHDHLSFDLSELGLKSFEQKIWEVLFALKIEKQYTKNEILEIYLNQVFLGGNIYGVARAADSYFGKDISDLTLKECALFAGMLQRPNSYSPVRSMQAAEERTATVLYVMKREEYITEEEYQQALHEPFQLNSTTQRRAQINLFPYYAEAVRKMFTEEQAFKADDGYPIEIYGRGVDVYTTLDPELQTIAEKALRTGIVKHEHVHRRSGGKYWGIPYNRQPNANAPSTIVAGEEYDALIVKDFDPETNTVDVKIPRVQSGEGPYSVPILPGKTWMDEFDILHPGYYISVKAVEKEGEINFVPATRDEHVQGALVAVQPSTGKVLALVGGYNFKDSQYIRATQSKVQPGSSFKPFLYAAAMAKEANPYTPATLIHDVQRNYGWNNWTPANFENEYFGWVTMRQALAHSYNAASVWLLDNLKDSRDAGIQYFRSFCKDSFHLDYPEKNLSIALGTPSFTPVEIAQAYSVFANGGKYVDLHMVKSIYQRQLDQNELPKLLFEHKERFMQKQGVSPEVAYLITYLMRAVVEEGTGKDALSLPFYHAGKTGTTDDMVRGWYVGYSQDILCVVYMGYDDHSRSLGVKMTGSKTALPVWMEFMSEAYKKHPELFGGIHPPEGIQFAKIHTHTGQLAAKDGPGVQTFPFREGTVPETAPSIPARTTYNTELRAYIDSE